MTHKNSICFKCANLFDYDCLYRKDELMAVCTLHFSRNAGNRKTCKDYKPLDCAEEERRKEIVKNEQI